MLPKPPTRDCADSSFMHAKLFSKFLPRYSFGSHGHDGFDLLLRQLCHSMARATGARFWRRVILSTLLNHVLRVMCWRSEKQVRWVDAIRIVTTMANKDSCGYFAIMQLPRITMHPYVTSAFDSDNSVMTHEPARPFPTRVSFFYMAPKSLLNCVCEALMLALATAISSLGGRRAFDCKNRATGFAYDRITRPPIASMAAILRSGPANLRWPGVKQLSATYALLRFSWDSQRRHGRHYISPATPDATLANITFTLSGTR